MSSRTTLSAQLCLEAMIKNVAGHSNKSKTYQRAVRKFVSDKTLVVVQGQHFVLDVLLQSGSRTQPVIDDDARQRCGRVRG